ncbi:hypothetical protein ACFY05_31860 [Microtetraspora fusca]|uniref:Queuine tRNA-ribosyltransferase n=1 Tax=Microtetraspora fusca TaxID=1997 RepID=A0ABW6VDS8_MICFU
MSTPREGFKALGSFHYFRSVDIAAFTRRLGPGHRFLADSGAFSAHTQGAAINIDEYADWLHRWKPYITHYINLDVIGDPAATWRNQRALEAEGLRPIPVFHAGSDFTELRRYLDAGYTYICLGGLVGRHHKAVMPWAIRCFREARGRAVFHGLGLTRWTDLAALPYYSVDSTSWSKAHRFGAVALWDDHRSRWINVKIGGRDVWRYTHLIRAHGGDPARLADRKTYTRNEVSRMAATAFHRAETWLRARHGPVAIPGHTEDQPGPHIYLADTNVDDLAAGASGVHAHLADATPADARARP